MEDETWISALVQSKPPESREPSILPDNGREKPPVPSLSEFNFEFQEQRWTWGEEPKRLDKAAAKLEARLSAGERNLPDRIDLRLTTELDPECQVVGLRLFVNRVQVKKGSIICPFELLKSTYRSDGFWIHSCSCHSPECAGIWGSTLVADMGDWIFWETNDKVVNQVFLFDAVEYRREIFAVCRRAIQTLKANPDLILEMEHVDGEALRRAWIGARKKSHTRVACDSQFRNKIASILQIPFSRFMANEAVENPVFRDPPG
jgi:hypothetical protein